MQFRRKKSDRGDVARNVLRLAALFACVGSLLLLSSNFLRDDDHDEQYDFRRRDEESPANDAALRALHREKRQGARYKEKRDEARERRQRKGEAIKSSAGEEEARADIPNAEGAGTGSPSDAAAAAAALPSSLDSIPPPPSTSLLRSPDASKDLPACDFAQHDLLVAAAAADEFDASRPAVFSNWDAPALESWKDRAKFQAAFGNYVQYVKGRDAQTLKDGRGEDCRASTRTLMDAMGRLFRKKNPDFDDEGEPGAASDANARDATAKGRRGSGRRATTNDGGEGKRGEDRSDDLLFFTNDVENPSFLDALAGDYSVPRPLANLPPFASGSPEGRFRVFSAMERGSSHPFHFHDATWLGQVSGSRLWYFLPPGTKKRAAGPKVNGCDYLLGKTEVPEGVSGCVQKVGDVVYFPNGWLHATCALEPWSVGVGGQGGSPKVYEQGFEKLPGLQRETSVAEERKKIVECGVLDEQDYEGGGMSPGGGAAMGGNDQSAKQPPGAGEGDWKWYEGNLNEYYNKLERDEHAKRNPNKITSYAVHRWMGPKASTMIHYELVRGAVYELVLGKYLPPSQVASNANEGDRIRAFDAGCGLGAGLMWFEQHEPNWDLVGHTISEEQHKWIIKDLPAHKFQARLRSYDEPVEGDKDELFNAVYSIEAAIHSPDLKHSLEAWSKALLPGGVIVIIDDFLSVGVSRDDPDVNLFDRSWMANAIHTTVEISNWADGMGMTLVRDRDLGSEFQIIKRNYRNKVPELRDEHGRVHQGWLGSKVRQKLMVEGKISYRLIVLQKKGAAAKKEDEAMASIAQSQSCASVPILPPGTNEKSPSLSITIDPRLMSGKGAKGGDQMACISGWYCCDQGTKIWDDLEKSRTERTGFLQLPRDLFGHYLTSFSKHLTDFYRTYPANYPADGTKQGIFLDIGGTGSVASGMQQVTSKFSNFAGPLKYWVLDSDPDAKKLTNALVCDIDDCPAAPDCGYDVTFSHTVLEHAARPWKSFDTIARITRRGGLTLHLVPWSYQYHATPDDNYRFSHKALRTLLEDRGFEVLDVGYDVCTQPEHMLKDRRDEHFERIWLTYVVGRKL